MLWIHELARSGTILPACATWHLVCPLVSENLHETCEICNFGLRRTGRDEIHKTIMWAKLEALVDGARIASSKLWN
jgi:hypothetical protein